MNSAAKTPKDQPVRDTIVTVFDRNFLVEAGAGSGKTESLAMRMAAGIERGEYRVEQMAAVTFTRKAAAELRGRFQLALERRLANKPGPAEHARLETALAGIERLFAGTIHAFCAHLLRERPVDARVAPGFEELGDVEDLALREQAWRDYVVEIRAGGSRPMLDLLDAGVRPQDLYEAFATVCQHEDVEFDMGAGTAPDIAPTWKAVDRFWKKLKVLKPETFHENSKCVLQARFEELDGRFALAKRDRLAPLASFLREWSRTKFTAKWWGPDGGFDNDLKAKVKALIDEFNDNLVEPFMVAFEAYVHHLAMQVLVDARDHYADVRRRRNAVNYVDLLRITARTLRECTPVRRALQKKYRWLFVDEFQDTDPIQAEIFLLLAGDETGSDAGADGPVDAFTLPLRAGALFVVGDPKQSIFRFRRADIDIYNRVGRRIEETGGARLSLTANFRSRPGVCAVANTVFPPLFGSLSAPYSPAFERLDAVRDDDATAKARPVVATLTTDAEEDRGDFVAREANAIASYIEAEVTAGRRRYGDFLVLTRFRPRLAAIASVFDERGIPIEVSGAGCFVQSPEVHALALLLSALADPLDAPALVGVLRGPLFGLSDPDLFRFKQAGGFFHLNVPLPAPGKTPAEDAKLRKAWGPALDAMRRLHEMVRLTRSLPAGAAVDQILDDTGWLALAGTTASGARAGHLLQAVDLVRKVVEEGGGLAAAAEALAQDGQSSEAEASPLEPGRRNVVRLMNLHKAKGLEAAVTFLADPGADRPFAITLRVERKGVRAIGHLHVARKGPYNSTVTIGKPLGWEAHEEEEKKYVAAERLRLMYVAGTRAKDLLVVCRSSKASANEAWNVFASVVTGAPALMSATGESKRAKKDAPKKIPATLRASAAKQRQAFHDRLTAPSWATTSVTGGSGSSHVQAVKGEGWEVAAGASNAPDATGAAGASGGGEPGAGAGRRADVGAAWGSLVHGLLEHVVRHPDASRPDLERLARWLTVELPDLRPVISNAVDLACEVVSAPFWKDVRGAKDVCAEVPFSVLVPARKRFGGLEPSAVPTVVRGVIDLLYRASDGWRILDYKTDVALGPGETLLSRHGDQLSRYRLAFEQASEECVAGRGVVGTRAGTVDWA
jgi:ATP-dependent helicase/nuclease subunit A